MDLDPQTELYIVNCSSNVCPDDPCYEGFEYVEQEGECCGTCKPISCIYHADNTTYILKDGDVNKYICETVSCHETNGSFVIEKTKTECPYLSTHVCEPGFEYMKKEGECCEKCEPVACIYDAPDNTRHVLKDGEEYRYKCETVTCHQTNGLFVIEKNNTECPYLSSDDCEPGFKYVKQEGECCGTCRQVACIYEAPDNTRHVLKDGEVDKYTCETVSCHEINDTFVTEKTKTECQLSSSYNCGPGFEYVKKEGECCGTCTQVACIYDSSDNTRHVLKDGKEYNFKCMNVTCLNRNGMFITRESYKQCPHFNSDDCLPGTEQLDKDGCCKICKTSNCVLEKNITRLHVNDCTSIEDVEVMSCTGHCDTKSMYLMENNRMMHSCSCCREEKFSNQQVKLKCANETEIVHDYVYIQSCRCTPTMCEDSKTSV